MNWVDIIRYSKKIVYRSENGKKMKIKEVKGRDISEIKYTFEDESGRYTIVKDTFWNNLFKKKLIERIKDNSAITFKLNGHLLHIDKEKLELNEKYEYLKKALKIREYSKCSVAFYGNNTCIITYHEEENTVCITDIRVMDDLFK